MTGRTAARLQALVNRLPAGSYVLRIEGHKPLGIHVDYSSTLLSAVFDQPANPID